MVYVRGHALDFERWASQEGRTALRKTDTALEVPQDARAGPIATSSLILRSPLHTSWARICKSSERYDSLLDGSVATVVGLVPSM